MRSSCLSLKSVQLSSGWAERKKHQQNQKYGFRRLLFENDIIKGKYTSLMKRTIYLPGAVFFFSFDGACCVILSWRLSKFVARLLTRVKELRTIKPRLVWINNEPYPCLSVPTALVFVWSSFQINYSPKNIIIQKNKRFIQWKDCVRQRARMLKLNASRYNGAFFPQNLSFSVNSTDTTSQHKYHFRKISVKRHERYPTRNVQSEPCVSFMSASRHLVRSRYLATYL